MLLRAAYPGRWCRGSRYVYPRRAGRTISVASLAACCRGADLCAGCSSLVADVVASEGLMRRLAIPGPFHDWIADSRHARELTEPPWKAILGNKGILSFRCCGKRIAVIRTCCRRFSTTADRCRAAGCASRCSRARERTSSCAANPAISCARTDRMSTVHSCASNSTRCRNSTAAMHWSAVGWWATARAASACATTPHRSRVTVRISCRLSSSGAGQLQLPSLRRALGSSRGPRPQAGSSAPLSTRDRG